MQHVVWKGVAQWWPRVEGGLKVWRWEGCQKKQALTPFYYNCCGRQVKTISSQPLHSLYGSAQNALKLLSFRVFTTGAPLQQRPSPLVTHTVLLLTRGAALLWMSLVMDCHNITVPTLTFGCKWLFFLLWAHLWILHQCLLFYLGFYRFIWIIYTFSFSRVIFCLLAQNSSWYEWSQPKVESGEVECDIFDFILTWQALKILSKISELLNHNHGRHKYCHTSTVL